MSSNMPRNLSDLINWCNVHTDLWTEHALSIGISAAQALQFKELVNDMVEANAAAEAARQASKDATMVLNDAVGDVRGIGNAFIFLMKSFAETTSNPGVYALAGITPNDPPGTLPAPVPPETFTAGVNPDGSLTIKWKVSQPAGVTGVQYLVFRRMNVGEGAGVFTQVATVGSSKMFVDDTLPIGIDRVDYMVQPKRNEVFGAQSNIFALQFGSVGGGGGAFTIASADELSHEQPMKVAA